MSNRRNPRRQEKKFYGKDHIHKPKKGKGSYKRKKLKQRQVDLEDEGI